MTSRLLSLFGRKGQKKAGQGMGCAQSSHSLEPSGALKGVAPSLSKLATGDSSSGFSSLAGNGTGKSTDAKPMRVSTIRTTRAPAFLRVDAWAS